VCDEIQARREELPVLLELSMPFEVEVGVSGILGLGPKLIDEDYSKEDLELIDTLVNNLIVALKNARSFEQIQNLNIELEAKNKQLEQTLEDLKQALRRVEMLETIKSNLSKFVPTTVNRMVEKSPTGDIQEARERDVSVLFLDIEGYTRLTEDLGATEVNALTEQYFSLFMEAIYENNGDVVETAGDGLMVLFLSEDDRQHAVEAVQTARTVIEKACSINQECRLDDMPILINIGICSGHAFVGASRFESIAGDRWTYTSHGTTINVAARLCGQAKGGAIFVAKNTVDRVRKRFPFAPIGSLALKNLTEQVEVFELRT
jgi:class 3 adenylate cyclase